MRKLTEIADKGDNLAMLRALRHRLADAIDKTTSGRDIASLARQLQVVSAQIEALEAMQQKADPIAEILREREITPIRDENGRRAAGE